MHSLFLILTGDLINSGFDSDRGGLVELTADPDKIYLGSQGCIFSRSGRDTKCRGRDFLAFRKTTAWKALLHAACPLIFLIPSIAFFKSFHIIRTLLSLMQRRLGHWNSSSLLPKPPRWCSLQFSAPFIRLTSPHHFLSSRDISTSFTKGFPTCLTASYLLYISPWVWFFPALVLALISSRLRPFSSPSSPPARVFQKRTAGIGGKMSGGNGPEVRSCFCDCLFLIPFFVFFSPRQPPLNLFTFPFLFHVVADIHTPDERWIRRRGWGRRSGFHVSIYTSVFILWICISSIEYLEPESIKPRRKILIFPCFPFKADP